MSVRLVIDMNLSPEWGVQLARHSQDAVHWSTVGDPRATDAEVMAWALANGRVVFTHRFDFGTALALTHAVGPSVLQVRGATSCRNRGVHFTSKQYSTPLRITVIRPLLDRLVVQCIHGSIGNAERLKEARRGFARATDGNRSTTDLAVCYPLAVRKVRQIMPPFLVVMGAAWLLWPASTRLDDVM